MPWRSAGRLWHRKQTPARRISAYRARWLARKVLSEVRATLIRKRADYGPQAIAAFGEVGVLIRAHDKICRLRHLLWEKPCAEPANEPLEDSSLDLAGYAVIGLLWRRGWWGLPCAAPSGPYRPRQLSLTKQCLNRRIDPSLQPLFLKCPADCLPGSYEVV